MRGGSKKHHVHSCAQHRFYWRCKRRYDLPIHYRDCKAEKKSICDKCYDDAITEDIIKVLQTGNGAMRMEWKYTLGEESEEEEWEREWHDLENCGK